MAQPFVQGTIQTPIGRVPQVSSEWRGADTWGTIKVRLGIGRMSYRVDPGLYALGQPDGHSPVLVTANYKMTFDYLRRAMANRDVWILVLDTKGINVWCAAGKGTFGTAEVVSRIRSSGLSQVVEKREVILPQLAGPGVAAYRVKKLSGFSVIYGPIRARDLPAFLDAGLNAAPEMRRKTFTLWERTVLIPLELVGFSKVAVFLLPVFFFVGGFGGVGEYWAKAMNHGLFAVQAILTALLAGAVLTPLLLPYLPGRAFSLKGLLVGFLGALALLMTKGMNGAEWTGILEWASWGIMIPTLAAFLAMNFTGASTFTSLSGVKKEMRIAVPLQIAWGLTGLVLWIGSRVFA